MERLLAPTAALVAVASTGIFDYQQDLCNVAACRGYNVILGILLLVGCCSHVDPVTATPLLMCAVHHGHSHTAELLLSAGADVNACDQNRRTAVHYASQTGDAALVELLVKAGADVNTRDKVGESALSLSAARGHRAVVALLLEHDADIEVEDDWGQTPLSKAILGRHVRVTAQLLGRKMVKSMKLV